jgi:serine/threonine protein phosphatase 1
MKNPLKTLEPNTKGRDFVIGDLHGSFSAFENLIKNLNFNPESDRIISVGDLVDRGPDSLKCLGLLRQPWFHAVLSNHEQMMAEKFKGGWIGAYWYNNGGNWGIEAYNDYNSINVKKIPGHIPNDSSSELFDLLPLVEELPFLITVNTAGGKKFHVLHAELPYGVDKVTDADLANPDTVLKLATVQRDDGDAFLWCRHIFYHFYRSELGNKERNLEKVPFAVENIFSDELSHIISGHTIVQQPLTVLGQTNIDTAAYDSYWKPVTPYSTGGHRPPEWAGLTCVELDTWKFYRATENTFSEVEPCVISKDDITD